MVASFATPQDAIDARDTDLRLSIWIGGVLTNVLSVSGGQDVGQAIASCKIVLPLPRPAWVTPNAAIEAQAGHNDYVGTVFSGYIPEWSGSIAERGRTLTLTVDGWCGRLAEPDRYDLEFAGPISARAMFVALCDRKGVPSYIAESVTTPDGLDEIILGGNNQIDDGKVIIKGGSSPLGTFSRLIKPFGYRVFDTPSGAIRLSRINGAPNSDPVVTFRDGVHLIDASRTYSVRDVVTYYDVKGPTYEDQFGGRVPIRSIPTIDPASALVIGGHRYKEVSNSDLVRQDLADIHRNVLEIDGGADAPVKWRAVGTPGLAPGDVVTLADTGDLEADGTYWLLGIDWSIGDGGYVATYKGWKGGGVALPSLVDEVIIPIQTSPVHVGDEYVAHYAMPSPVGTEKVWTFTLPDKASVANIRGLCHSFNSQTVSGEDTELTVTRWEVWKAGTDRTDKKNKAESSATMPQQAEVYWAAKPFATDLSLWPPFAGNLKTLDAGTYDLVLASGKAEGFDDGEVRNVFLQIFGTIEPAVVNEGGGA